MAKNKKRGVRALVIILVIIILLGGGLYAARKIKSGQGAAPDTYTVRSETTENIIDIAGTISAAQEQKLQAAGSGTVMQVFVGVGDTVKKGDIILQLDDVEQQYNLLRHDYDMEQKRISGSALELKLMRQQREVLVQRIQDRKITASFDGIIASFTAAAGDYLEAKDNVGIILDRSYLRTEVEVVETDAPKLKAGQKVALTFPAHTAGSITGRVVSFPSVGTVTTRGTTVVKAEIRVDESPDDILPNFSFIGKIEIAPPVTVLLVEQAAIGHENGRPFAEIISGDSTKRVDVSVEPYGAGFVNIKEGLKEGDVVKAQASARISGMQRRPGGAGQGGQPPPGAVRIRG